MLMKRFSKASMHLFAVEAVLWYSSQKEIKDKHLSQGLLTYFCSRVKEEFEPTPLLSTRTSYWDDDTTVYRLAKEILLGKAEWLEDGIIKMSVTRTFPHTPSIELRPANIQPSRRVLFNEAHPPYSRCFF